MGVEADRDPEIRKLNMSVFGRENVRPLNVPVKDALFVEILKAMEHLCDVDGAERFGEGAKFLTDPSKGTVLHQFQDDVQVVLRANGVNIFDDVGVVQLLEEKDLRFDGGQVLGLHIGQLEALDSHKVACVYIECLKNSAETTSS